MLLKSRGVPGSEAAGYKMIKRIRNGEKRIEKYYTYILKRFKGLEP